MTEIRRRGTVRSRHSRVPFGRQVAVMKKHPLARFVRKILSRPGVRAITPDSWYLAALYRIRIGRKLDLRNPRGFNEKLQWLKINVRDPEFSKLVDKYEVRDYIASAIGAEHVVPLAGGPWNSFDEIDFSALPDKFVLKCTHDSGGLVVCTDKKTLDVDAARRKLEPRLRVNFYWPSREPPYAGVKPRLIAEEYVEAPDARGLSDYKFYVFNGKTRMINVCADRFSAKGLHITFYDENWNLLPFARQYPRETVAEPVPKDFELLKSYAERLAGDLLFARVDFYLPKDKVYVGEITLYPGGGLEPFDPPEWDEKVGAWLDLSPAATKPSPR